MLALLGVVVSVGFADSVNPSTIGPGLYLASYVDGVRSLGGFILGVFTVSAAGGVALVFGAGSLVRAHHPTAHTEHLVELAAGIALAAVAVGVWLLRARVSAHVIRAETKARRASFLVGAGIMAVEFPTALPYFAVIATVSGSGRPLVTQIMLLMLFNFVFVAPLLAILIVRSLAGQRGVAWLACQRSRFERSAGAIVASLILLVAVILLGIGLSGLTGP